MIKKILANILLNNFKRIFYILIKSKYEFLLPGYINFILKKNTPLGKKDENRRRSIFYMKADILYCIIQELFILCKSV